ncbi:uncharacterized protein LOC126674868 isoform X2 [Mercurialis annua]|nr:uncharacterized protein LOC126674868 isoform X2 [Mercurialis annua]
MCWSGQVPTRLLRTPDTDVDVLLERALKYAGMRKTLAELKDRMSYERWVVAACNPEYLDGSLEPPLPPRVLKAFKNGVQIDEYDEVYKLLILYGLTMHINELKHRISIRTRYLVTQLQGAELVESSPISRLKEVLRYNGFHELLKYLEYRIANDNRGGSRDALTRNPRPSALALVAPRMFGDHNEYIDAEDHGEHAAAGGVRIQLATAAASGVPSQHAGGGSESPIQHTASG